MFTTDIRNIKKVKEEEYYTDIFFKTYIYINNLKV